MCVCVCACVHTCVTSTIQQACMALIIGIGIERDFLGRYVLPCFRSVHSVSCRPSRLLVKNAK